MRPVSGVPEAPPNPTAPPPAPATRRPWWRSPGPLLAAGLAVLLLIVAGVVAVLTGALRDDPADAHVVTGPLAERREATLELVDGATTVTVGATDLGDRLYRVATPADSHLRPRVTEEAGRLRVHLVERGPRGVAAVEVQLHSGVRWQLRVVGGATSEVIDLRAGRLSELEVAGGVTRLEVTLPEPAGAVPVRLSGGAGQVAVRAPAGAPVRVMAGAGAGTVILDGTTHGGVAAGREFTPPGWAAAPDRYDVRATAGVGTLTVDRL
jgi:hypothetical protein